MRDRALGETGMVTKRFPTHQSLETFGRYLCNFFEWCALRGRSWTEVEYKEDLVEGYQKQMLSGAWSATTNELSKRTVNNRVDEACRFLQWAANNDSRKPFRVLSYLQKVKVDSAHSSHGHKSKDIKSRVGKVRPDPVKLSMPTDEQISKWLNSVRIEKGPTKELMCELILRTGIRREECVQWRTWTLPKERSDWKVQGQYVSVIIEYGAKGAKTVDKFGEEKGPSRVIMVPLDLAGKLHHYREKLRADQRDRFVNAAKNTQEKKNRFTFNPHQLFLSDHTCEPVSAASLYKTWTNVSGKFEDWSPHLGRHYWACQTLLATLKQEALILKAGGHGMTSNCVYQLSIDVILLKIQPQLGHISKETTLGYVKWVGRALGFDLESDDWWLNKLEGENNPEAGIA